MSRKTRFGFGPGFRAQMRPHKTESCLLFVLLALLYGCAGPSRTNDGDLVFLGTVEKLQPSAISESPVNWVAEFRVDQVLSGTFTNKTFSFRIHRPSLSGLEVGKQYRVEAKWNGKAYSVDPDQWLKKAPTTVSKEAVPLSRQGEIHKPTPEEISRLFRFPEDFTLRAEEKPGTSQTALGTFLWEIEYSNPQRSLEYITVALLKGGTFLSSDLGKRLKNRIEQLSQKTPGQMPLDKDLEDLKLSETDRKGLLSLLTSATSDGRVVYTLAAVGPGGCNETYILTSKNGRYDLLVAVFEDFEDDTPPEKQMHDPIRMRKSIPKIIEELEEMVYR